MTIGNKIAQYRKQMNITQDGLAQQLEVTNQAVSKWESDQCCPDIMLLPRIADIFGVTIDALFDRAPKEDPQKVEGLPWPDDNVLRVVMYVGHRLEGLSINKKGFSLRHLSRVDGAESVVTIHCGDVTGNVNVGADVTCGDVEGYVNAGCGVNCRNVTGNVNAGTDVSCGDVGGDVDAGCSVKCGNVGGSVDAGTDVTCSDVTGDIDAGCNVSCGNVDGDIDAGCGVTIRK